MSRVLLTDPRAGGLARAVEEVLGETPGWADLDRDRAEIDVWFCAGSPPADALDLPALRWIQTGWAGVEGWFQRSEWRPGVTLTRTVGEYPRQIAEYVFAYLLAQELDIPRALDQMRSRVWERWTPGSLAGRTLLVVGYGSIGREVAAVGRALAMETLGIRRGPVSPEDRANGVWGVDALNDALGQSDVIVNLLPLTRETESFWTRERFARMREGAVFVNVSRGATVDDAALLEGIARGRPGRAILDVFRDEPLPADHPLRGHERIWITPHIAGVARPPALAAEFIANWRRYRSGEPLRNVVDRRRGY